MGNEIWKLRAAAVMWLRYERQCPVVCMERGIGSCVPDVVGVTPKRFMVEIEIKQSMADFRNNSKKWGMQVRAGECESYSGWDWLSETLPQQFYFLVPAKLMEKAKAELPTGFGLMAFPAEFNTSQTYSGIPKPIMVIPAPVDKRARKLSVGNVRKLVKHQSGTLSMLVTALSNLVDRYTEARVKAV